MTLEEYLVKLGWQIDEPSFKRFVSVLSATGARTAELASVAVETAGAVELMVSRIASKYDNLYYMSQRTGQSVQYLQSTQYAFKQIGLSAEDANASIEGIAETLRTQPWLRAIFGGADTPQKVANKLAHSGLPYFLQVQFAQMVGMSEKVLWHYQHFAQIEADAEKDFARRQKEAGLDPKQLSEKAVDYSRSMNKLESDLQIFGDLMSKDFFGPTESGVHVLDDMVQALNRADAATNGWLGRLEGIAAALASVAAFEQILRWLFGLGKGSLVGRALGGAATVAGSAIGLSGAAIPAIAGSLLLGSTTAAGESDAAERARREGTPGHPSPEAQERINMAIKFFEAAGFPKDSAIGIASGLYSESNLDPNSVNKQSGAYGIAQWLTKSRIADIEKKFKQPLRGSPIGDQLAFILYELTQGNDPQARAVGEKLYKGGLGGRQAAGAFLHGFERPGPAGEWSDMTRAGPLADALSKLASQQNVSNTTKNLTVNSHAVVNIQGAPDAASTAKTYVNAHNDINDNLVSNLNSATR